MKRVWVLVVVVVVIVAVARGCYRPSLDTTSLSPMVYLPLVLREHRAPDKRFGIAEHTPEEAELLGLAGADYVSGQWRLPLVDLVGLEGDTAVFLRPTERPHWSTWLLCSWSAADGWYDEAGCREWVENHPGMDYIVGNELSVGGSVGDGHWVSTDDYARWYHEAWNLIKGEDPTASVAPYGSVGQTTAGILLAVWDSYLAQFGTPLPVDFYPVHHYCHNRDEPWWCFTKLSHWIDWLERHRGSRWQGPQDYRLTEWGLMAWAGPVPLDTALALMEGMIPRLKANNIGITQHAWWPSGNDEWPSQGTWLVEDGKRTKLGDMYSKLALE